jgi:DNA-binding transcriptional ArsR family regulator
VSALVRHASALARELCHTVRPAGLMDAIWRALADPTRRRLVELLRDGPRTTGELCAAFATSRFAVMKHLRVLERVGLVTVRRDGRKRWNRLNPEQLQAVSGRWSGPVPPATPPALPSSGRGGQRPDTREVDVFVDAVPWKVFDALTVNVSAWWGTPHLKWTGASNLIVESQPGGRFYEEWGHRQGALRAIVTAIRQNELLELRGPIFEDLCDERLRFSLEAREGGTLLTVTWDEVPAETIDNLVRDRLKAFVERGRRSGIVG